MALADNISKLRNEKNMSQEELAEKLGLTRQAIQKWESGAAKPDLENITKIAKTFSISIDSLIFDSNPRMLEELPGEKKILPLYSEQHRWESYAEMLLTEYRQSIEEGIDIQSYKNLFEAVYQMPKNEYKAKIADILFELIRTSPKIADYPYDEPSALEEIQRKSKGSLQPLTASKIDEKRLKNKITGAWYGRICGCLLGKPIEGIHTDELHPLLKETNNYPLHRYLLNSDLSENIFDKYKFRLRDRCYADVIRCAPADDDTNYTVLAQVIIEEYGKNFQPYDVAKAWVDYQPKKAYFTAERVAFCNFVNGFAPSDSAIYKNPFREWIGAQIRGDYFGYINPGNPKLAAEMAWRDASISHVKNGIYGEMFVAAMLAQAAVTDNIEEIILAGLAQIPSKSRLHEAIEHLIAAHRDGLPQAQCFSEIHRKFNEHDEHDWCHTISNALIVTGALLYGKGDFGKSICMAVETGFDTDCNGATVGSILGMRNGIEGIEKKWTEPVNGLLETTIFGIGKISIEECIAKTLKQIHQK